MHTKKLMLFASTLIAMIGAGTAHAAPCDARVVDETGKFGQGLSKVEEAADKLATAGADVRVRMVNSLGGFGNMDQLENSLERDCGSWQGASGGRKNNLVVLMLMPTTKADGKPGAKAGLYYGSMWTQSIDGKWIPILKNVVAPYVGDGDYAGGVTAGLNSLTQIVAVQVQNPTGVQTTPVQVPQQPPVVVHEQPTDFTGLWWVFGSIVGLGALVLLVALISRASGARGRRRAAQQTAKAEKGACTTGILEYDTPLQLAEARVNKAALVVSEEDATPLRTKLAKTKNDLSSASLRLGQLDQSATNPDRDGLTVEEYETMASEYKGIRTLLDGVRTGMENVESEADKLEKLAGDIKPAIDGLSGDIDVALKVVEGVKAQGFNVDSCEKMLTEAERFYDQAGAAMGQKRFTQAKTLCDQGKAKAAKAQADADALPDRKAAIDAGVTKLENRLPQVKSDIQAAKGVADEVIAGYAEVCFNTVRGNGVEAIKRFEGAVQAVAAAKQAASMEKQQWSDAENVVAGAHKALDEALSFMRSITSLKANLEKAKQDAPNEIAAAKADIALARDFIKKNAGDINDPLELDLCKKLHQAEQDVVQATGLVAKRDYPKAVQLALGANKAADAVLSSAQGDQEATVRQRRLAESSVQQAQTAIDRTKEYLQDHDEVGPYTAKEKLSEARTLLGNAKATNDLATRISLAGQAEEKAKEGLRSVKAAVKKAQEARSYDFGRPSSGSSSSDAFFGGLAGGVIGSSIGSSRSHSHSSSSSSDSIFGGGGGGGSIDIGGGGGGGGSFDIGGGGGGGGGSTDI